jgi:hypothetical protein
VDVDVDLPASRRPDANARICSNARGRHGRVGEELAAGMNENAPPTGKRGAGLSNRGGGRTPHYNPLACDEFTI